MPTTLQIPTIFQGLRKPARHKAFYGGRGGGKSHSFALALILLGCERRELRWLCAREIQRSLASSVKKLLEDKIEAAGLGATGNGFYRSTEASIQSADGRVEFLFTGLRTNPETVRSVEGLDGCWIEEANTVSQRSIDLLTPTLRKPGSELWWSWNPRHASDPAHKMFVGDANPPPDSIVQKVTYADNPWFPDVLRAELEWDRRRDPEKYRHVWEGDLLTLSESRVIRDWRIDDIDERIPDGCVLRYGADWGFSNDPTVLIGMYVWDRTVYIRHERWKVGCEIDETPAFFAGDDPTGKCRWANPHKLGGPYHSGLPDAARARIVADNARPETISYLKKRGFDIRPAIKGAGSVADGIEFLRSHEIVVHPECKHTINEFGLYSYAIDPLTGDPTTRIADGNDHCADAARYALEGVRRRRVSSAPGLGPAGMLGPRVIGI